MQRFHSMCSADGWYVLYKDETIRRIACFAGGGFNASACVIGSNGLLEPVREFGEIVRIWHDGES